MQIVAAIVFFLVAVLCVGLAIRMRRAAERDAAEAGATIDWPTVTGTITTSQVGVKKVSSGGQSRSTVFVPVIGFTYTVDGTRYTGNRIRVHEPKSSYQHEGAQTLLDPYPPGAEVQVAYDPARPERSVLAPGATRDLWNLIIAPVVLLLLGVAMAAGAVYALIAA